MNFAFISNESKEHAVFGLWPGYCYFTSFDLKPLLDSPPKFITISKHYPEALINFRYELESCDLRDKINISLGGNPNENYTQLQDNN